MGENRIQSTTKSKCKLFRTSKQILFSLFQYKNYAVNQPEFYRPADNDDDDSGPANITAKEIEQEAKEVRVNFHSNLNEFDFLGESYDAKGQAHDPT